MILILDFRDKSYACYWRMSFCGLRVHGIVSYIVKINYDSIAILKFELYQIRSIFSLKMNCVM
jgi:hypothetical protein